MLLAVDVGNTNTVFGLFNGETLQHQWRISTDLSRSADEYQAILVALAQGNHPDPFSDISGIVIGSVVPQITSQLVLLCQRWFKLSPLIVSVKLDLGLPILVREPHRVGVDRLLNAIAARITYGFPCITVDLGTATKFDVVNEAGAFIGGAIAPGLYTAAGALVKGTAQLPMINFAAPPSPIGDDTISAMQSGIVLGYVSLIEGLLTRIQRTLPGEHVTVIATGGLSSLIYPLTDVIDYVHPTLTLEGLRMVYENNISVK